MNRTLDFRKIKIVMKQKKRLDQLEEESFLNENIYSKFNYAGQGFGGCNVRAQKRVRLWP